jgi:hypothetical protein
MAKSYVSTSDIALFNRTVAAGTEVVHVVSRITRTAAQATTKGLNRPVTDRIYMSTR